MRKYIPANLGIQFSGDAWDDLFDKLSDADSGYEDKTGVMKLFWWKIGERREHIMPWVALIPDTSGLSVVKAGIALVLKVCIPDRIRTLDSLLFS